MPRTLETNAGIAAFLQTAEFFGLGLDYDVRVPDLLRAVTRDEVHEAARRTLDPSKATVVVAGPYDGSLAMSAPRSLAAVFFDVDFTLIYPGPTFQGEGYARFCARHGIRRRSARGSTHAVRAASSILDDAAGPRLRRGDLRALHAAHHRGDGRHAVRRLDDCAREIYDEWAACQHFFLYDDVAPVLRELAARGLKLGLISNSHRCLTSFQQHFELEGLIAAAVSSSEHGYMKPHPSIFEAALTLAGVAAGESVMVGDSLTHDIEGARARRDARRARASLRRSGAARRDVPVIRVDGGAAGTSELVTHELTTRRDARHCFERSPRSQSESVVRESPSLIPAASQAAAGQQMQMDVEHRLAGLAVAVEHRPVAALGVAMFASRLRPRA